MMAQWFVVPKTRTKQRNTIAELERLLELAKYGRVEGLIATFLTDEGWEIVTTGDCCEDPTCQSILDLLRTRLPSS